MPARSSSVTSPRRAPGMTDPRRVRRRRRQGDAPRRARRRRRDDRCSRSLDDQARPARGDRTAPRAHEHSPPRLRPDRSRARRSATDYDLIVLDAPCTGLGVLRRHPDAKWRLVADDVPRLAQRAGRAPRRRRAAPRARRRARSTRCARSRAPKVPIRSRALAARTGLRLVAEHRTWPPDADAFYLARLERA